MKYTIELVKKECISEYGFCYVPKSVMKSEKLCSGNIAMIESTVNMMKYTFICTVWEKRPLSNSIIELHPCCFRSDISDYPEEDYIIGEILKTEMPIPTSLRITMETSIQNYSVSFNRRLSQYLHRVPLLAKGLVVIGKNKYMIASSLPSNDKMQCQLETNIMIQQKLTCTKVPTLDIHAIPTLDCPYPGLEGVFSTLISSILYYKVFKKEIKEYGIRPYKGVLISGDHGCGKSAIIQSAIQVCSAYMSIYKQTVSPSTLRNTNYGESAQYIQQIFRQASVYAESNENNIAIIIFEDLDRICVKRDEYDSNNTQTVSQLLTCIDGLVTTNRIVVIATSTQPYLLDAALRRAGRFDKEAAILPPTQHQRRSILQKYFAEYGVLEIVEKYLEEVSLLTRGFSCADLVLMTRQVVIAAVERTGEKELTISLQDIISTLNGITPSIMKTQEHVTGIQWDEIGGMEQVKRQLRRYVEWPILHKEEFQRFHLTPPRGVLLYGPPGCAKTTLARALASESHSSFWSLNTSQIYSPYVGESEFIIRQLFANARAALPAVVFLDEMDALVCRRSLSGNDDVTQSRIMATFLTEMDGIENSDGIIILGATNRPEMIDDALLRPGRFDQLIYIPPPDEAAREAIFRVYLSKMQVDGSVNVKELAKQTNGYSGADIENICRESVYSALREDMNTESITQDVILKAIKRSTPSITQEMIEHYTDFASAFYKWNCLLQNKDMNNYRPITNQNLFLFFLLRICNHIHITCRAFCCHFHYLLPITKHSHHIYFTYRISKLPDDVFSIDLN